MLYFGRVGEIECGVMYPIIMTNKQGKITQFRPNITHYVPNENVILHFEGKLAALVFWE